MDDETREIVASFVAESREAIDEVEPLLIEMSVTGGEPDTTLIDRVFRLFHSMKGSAGYLHFLAVERVTHRAETVLVELRSGALLTTPKLTETLCQVLDAVRVRLAHIAETGEDTAPVDGLDVLVERLAALVATEEEGTSVSELVGPFIIEARELLDTTEQALLSVETAPEERAPLDTAFRSLHSLKGNCGFLEYGELEHFVHAAETLLGAIVEGEVPRSAEVVGALLAGVDALRTAIGRLPADASFPEGEARLAELLRVEAEGRARMEQTRLGEILIARGDLERPQLEEALSTQTTLLGATLTDRGVITPAQLDAGLAEQAERRGVAPRTETRSADRGQTSLRVDVGKLDALMDLVGELIIAETAVIHAPSEVAPASQGLHKAMAQLARITRSLQDVAMSLRMVPIEGTFRKMVRVVRDVATKQGKSVSLSLDGEETEVDKTVAEIISDPLVHLVRNAVDHGIELPETRKARGKPAEGSLQLSASHVGGEIWVRIQDDGGGISRSRVLEKAIERGLTNPATAAALSDNDVFAFIFEPGFSTAPAVTDISGRGVGMDVVKRQIERVKGRIDISSQSERGTTITLRIPLTLAIIEGMLVRVGETSFTIPLLCIRESVVPRGKDVTRLADGQEIVRIRGQLLPVLRMHQFFEIEPLHHELEDGILVVVEDGGHAVCLFVDALIGQRQTVIKSLSGFLGDPRSISGCTVLGDGRISLILDVARLIGVAPHVA